MAGEVHYFRLRRAATGRTASTSSSESGCDAVATYMPWLVHETPRRRDRPDRRDQRVPRPGRIPRPGRRAGPAGHRPARPVRDGRAEERGHPVPRLREHPEAVPARLGRRAGPVTRTLDYRRAGLPRRGLAAGMPRSCRCSPSRLVTRGGPVIAVQLDNEIGMLSWVTQHPRPHRRGPRGPRRLDRAVRPDAAVERYGADPKDVDGWHLVALRRHDGTEAQQLPCTTSSAPTTAIATPLPAPLHEEPSARRRRVPFLINMHGTGGGRGRTYPIGISQLSRPTRGQPQMTSGSDHYLGDLTVENVPDLYVMQRLHGRRARRRPAADLAGVRGRHRRLRRGPRQPAHRPETVELKTRLCLAQGNRLINYYLFAGGAQPAARRAGRRRQRPHRLHRRAARLRRARRPGGRARA